MQTYTLYFTATFDLPIQAASREAALAAGQKACDENDMDELCCGDEWTVGVSKDTISASTTMTSETVEVLEIWRRRIGKGWERRELKKEVTG